MSIINKDMQATIVLCNTCDGHVMSVIDRFASASDLREIELAKHLKLTVLNKSVAFMHRSSWSECHCRRSVRQ